MSHDAVLASHAVDSRGSMTIAALFEQCVSAAPDGPAILTPERIVSYRQLDRIASRIADRIDAEKSPAQGPVALVTKDTVACLAGMLGAAKAGRIFIPLDLTFPEPYLAETIAGSGSTLVLADSASLNLAARVQGSASLLVLEIGDEGPEPAKRPIPVTPGSPAYILYTSGSTGKAKGVVLSHEFLTRYVGLWSKSFAIGPGDRMSLLFSCNWGTGMHNTFVALLSGACVCPFEVRSSSAAAFSQWLCDFGITILVTTSSLFRTWIAALPQGSRFPRLRLIRNVSEPLYSEDIVRAAPHFTADCRIVHSLGTTETGTVAIHAIGFDDPPEAGILPVGRAAAGIQIRLEDETGALVAAGQTGEIVLHGRCLALGYWNDQQLTDGAFRPDPTEPAMRSYRSGDFGRFRKDGLLEYLGRKDRKVKVRGFTIELYEIERALLHLNDVRETVVLLQKDRSGEGRLVAYVVGPKSGAPEIVQSLCERLGAHLPAHMIPSDVVVLPAMPLTERGKVDREALPTPLDKRQQRAPHRAPSNEVEASLVAIWQEILNLKTVGVDDDFYDLGGTSLQAFLILARIATKFGRDLPPTRMLSAPTVLRQAELLHDAGRRNTVETLLPFRMAGKGEPLFIVHGGGGDIMFARELVREMKSDRPVYGLQPPPLDGSRRLLRKMEAICVEYLAEIRKAQPRGPYYLAGYSFGGFAAYEMAQQLMRLGETVAFLGIIDTNYDRGHLIAQEQAARRISRHARGLRNEHVLSYLSTRAFKTLRHRYKLLREKLRHLPNELRSASGLPIPYEARAPYYRRIYFAATRNYAPRPFVGKIVMFSRAGASEWHRKRWLPLALDGLTVHEIPAEHREMVWPPFSRLLACAFDECLESAGRGE